MPGAEWQKVREIFDSALRRKPDERRRFVNEVCGDDKTLLAEVESLLSSHDGAESFMETPAVAEVAHMIEIGTTKLELGKRFGHYEIIELIGEGGMGEVYLAEDTRLRRKVALKLLPSSFTDDSERLRRFEREARAASALNHPNILTIYEVGSFDGRQFIAAEYVEGQTLRQRQASSRLKLTEILDLTIQVASALAAAHRAGIVHRDIKPENIMLRSDGYAKVVDFGLAKLTEGSRASAESSVATVLQVDTVTGVVMGTTAYMSPEQARGLELDARTDLWSLGVVLYEMLSGRMPFKGDTPSDLIVQILDRDPAPLVSSPVVPSELAWIVRKALRKDREERYQTALELLGDLRGLKQQLEFAAQLDSVTDATNSSGDAKTSTAQDSLTTQEPTPLPTEVDRGIATASLEQYPTRLGRRNRSLAIAIGVSLLLIGGILVAYKLLTAPRAPLPFQVMQITRITNSGKVIDSALSPDGKYIVYSLSDAGKQSLWIRQVSTANDKMIVPPGQFGFFGVTFSPDGNDLYYAIKAMDLGTLYRLPALGGTPVKILEHVDGPVSISPNGKQLVLVRGNYPNPGESALVIANTDGTGVLDLAIRKAPEYFAPLFFTGPSWSPDGKLVAVSVGRQGSFSHVFAFSIADGTAKDLTPDPWRFVARVAWLPDMSGLLVVAGEAVGRTQIWFVSYPNGERRRITNDLNYYRSISLAADGTKFSTIQAGGLVNIWIAPEGDAKRAVQLPTGNVGFFGSSGSTLSWTPDDGIVFVSTETGNLDIWFMDSKGENRRQLTANPGADFSPVVSRDGRYVVFTSSRDGNSNIWRMGIDGSDQKPLTSGVADGLGTISPDGRWVFYSSLVSGKPTLRKVSIDGGSSIEISKGPAISPIVSPDSKFLAYLYPDSADPIAPPNRLAIMPIDGGEPIKTFSFQGPTIIATSAHWSADGRSILYTTSNNNVTNIWSQPVDGGLPRQVTDFKDSFMTGFAWSHDEKILACTRGILLSDIVLISESR